MQHRISRRDILKQGVGAAGTSAVLLTPAFSPAVPDQQNRIPSRLADEGWVWDGQAINGQWYLSIFGTGEGARWFGVKNLCHMFHDNTAMAMEKVRDFQAVVCEISKWKYHRLDHPQLKGLGNPMYMAVDPRIPTKREEAAKVAALAQSFPNIVGAIDDDLMGHIKKEGLKPEEYATVYQALKAKNPNLKLWSIVYSTELKKEDWEGFKESIDVMNLWVWKSSDLPNLERYVDQCQAIFNKPIIVGAYMRDFTTLQATPKDMLKVQWDQILKMVQSGTIAGFSIIGGFMIDLHPDVAVWIRDFIRAN